MSKFITLDNLKSALIKFKEKLSPSLAKLDSITGIVTANKLQNPDHPTDLVTYEAFQVAVPLVQSMNLTGTTVGQIIKVKAVDESGKPTEWEAVDIAGDKWELITDVTLTEDGDAASQFNVTRNDKGEDFEYRQCMVCLSGKVIDGWPKGACQQIGLYENNQLTGSNASFSLSRLAAGEGGTEYKTTVEMSIFGNLVRLIACGGTADTSSLIMRNDTSIDTFRSIRLSCYGNKQWASVPLAAGGRIVIYGRK